MSERDEAYAKAILERLTTVCVDRTDDGECRHDPGLECTVRAHLGRAVQAVRGVRSDQIEEYAERIRRTVCSVCGGQNDDGTCDARDRADCCLDRYMVLVVEAIEEVDRRFDADEMAAAP